MDVNGTTAHLVVGRAGWLGDGEAPAGLAWHPPDRTLRLAPLPFVFPERSGNRRVGPADRRGAARDRYGNWFWIGPGHDEVRLQTAGTRGSVRYWPPETPTGPDACPPGEFAALETPGPPPQRLSGLTITTGHYLVVGAPDLPAVLVLDLHSGGPPTTLPWPTALTSLDLSADPSGGTWLLDTPPAGRARLWRLDGRWEICDLAGSPAPTAPVPDFVPSEPGHGAPAAAELPGSPVEVSAERAVAVESLPDGTALVLDRGGVGPARLLRHDGAAEITRWPLAPLADPLDVAFLPSPATTPPPGGTTGTVFLVEDQGDQAFALELDGDTLAPGTRYLPMRLFSGKALVAAGGRVHYDLGELWLPLADRRSPRYQAAGTVDVGPFDGDDPGTRWNRVTLDGDVPVGTTVRVSSRAADELPNLLVAPWRDEPTPYRRHRSSEVPYHRYAPPGCAGGTYELLLQRAEGRYLQVRVALTGNGRHTPRLWAMRAHAPRFSYLRAYLPDAYQEDPASADFLDRYLAITEGLLTTHEGEVAQAQTLLDVTTLDAEHLDWLARWLGTSLDPAWDEARSRLLVQHAVALFGRRGTVRGLVEAVRLATDLCPDSTIFDGVPTSGHHLRVVEEFRTRPPRRAHARRPATGPRVVAGGARWQLTDGREELDRRWIGFVRDRHPDPARLAVAWGRPVGTDGPAFAEPFAPLTPAGSAEADLRRDFVTTSLAMPYADATGADVGAYRSFLAHRYGTVAAVPADGAPLADWIDVVSHHLPATRAAHRFSVLVPVPLGSTDTERETLVARVARVVEDERPAHTAYEVRASWAAFRVGVARLGLETTVGPGSRFVALTIGSGRLAEGYLAGRAPDDAADRWVVGRDRVATATNEQARSGWTEARR